MLHICDVMMMMAPVEWWSSPCHEPVPPAPPPSVSEPPLGSWGPGPGPAGELLGLQGLGGRGHKYQPWILTKILFRFSSLEILIDCLQRSKSRIKITANAQICKAGDLLFFLQPSLVWCKASYFPAICQPECTRLIVASISAACPVSPVTQARRYEAAALSLKYHNISLLKPDNAFVVC